MKAGFHRIPNFSPQVKLPLSPKATKVSPIAISPEVSEYQMEVKLP